MVVAFAIQSHCSALLAPLCLFTSSVIIAQRPTTVSQSDLDHDRDEMCLQAVLCFACLTLSLFLQTLCCPAYSGKVSERIHNLGMEHISERSKQHRFFPCNLYRIVTEQDDTRTIATLNDRFARCALNRALDLQGPAGQGWDQH